MKTDKIANFFKYLGIFVYLILFIDVLFTSEGEKYKILYIDSSKTINMLVYLGLAIIIIISLFKKKKI